MSEKIKNLLKSYFFDGILLIALGIVMLVWPESSLKMLCIVIGAVVGMMGLIKLITFFTNKGEDRRAGDLLVGLIQLALGVALIVASGFFITVFQYITGVILVYGAILMFVQAYRLSSVRGPMFVTSLVFACITTVLAVIIFINPEAFASFITQLHGVALIVEGLSMIIVLRKIRIEIKTVEVDRIKKLAEKAEEAKEPEKSEESAEK